MFFKYIFDLTTHLQNNKLILKFFFKFKQENSVTKS